MPMPPGILRNEMQSGCLRAAAFLHIGSGNACITAGRSCSIGSAHLLFAADFARFCEERERNIVKSVQWAGQDVKISDYVNNKRRKQLRKQKRKTVEKEGEKREKR